MENQKYTNRDAFIMAHKQQNSNSKLDEKPTPPDTQQPSTENATLEPEMELLESDKRLSECMLWEIGEKFYDTIGIDAWNTIPFYPTCNAYIGRTYAEMILSFLLDYLKDIDKNHPVYIIEMAAGSGGLCFYVTKELLKRKAHFSVLNDVHFIYVATDFAEKNVKSWEANPKFKPFIEQNVLDFAVFRPEDESELFLRRQQKRLTAHEIKNPIITLANYFFDTIRHDLFRIDAGEFYEGRVNFYRELNESNRHSLANLNDLKKTEHFHSASTNYYQNPKWNEILHQYQNMFQNASILFPMSAMKCIDRLLQLSNKKLVLISSDKGFTWSDYMENHWEQHYSIDGSFSFMVNFHAIGLYFTNQGGLFYSTADRNVCLSTVMGIFIEGVDYNQFANSNYYFKEKVDNENPINSLYYVQDLMHNAKTEKPETLFNAYMSLLHLTNNDPIVFYFIGNPIYTMFKDLTFSQRHALHESMNKVFDNFFTIGHNFNTLSWLGMLYYALDCYDQCLATFEQSINVFGADSSSLYYIAACNEVLGNYERSLDYYQKTLTLDPDCPLTQSGIDRMSKALRS